MSSTGEKLNIKLRPDIPIRHFTSPLPASIIPIKTLTTQTSARSGSKKMRNRTDRRENSTLDSLSLEILNILSKRKVVTLSELVTLLGKNKSTIRTRIRILEKLGLVTCSHVGRLMLITLNSSKISTPKKIVDKTNERSARLLLRLLLQYLKYLDETSRGNLVTLKVQGFYTWLRNNVKDSKIVMELDNSCYRATIGKIFERIVADYPNYFYTVIKRGKCSRYVVKRKYLKAIAYLLAVKYFNMPDEYDKVFK